MIWLTMTLLALTADTTALSRPTTTQQASEYEYVGKVVCGPQPDSSSEAVVRGWYATTVNVWNEAADSVRLTKQVVWTLPPGAETPVRSRPATRPAEVVPPGYGFAADCLHLIRSTDVPPNAFHEGLIVIRSNRPLTVVGLYSAAPIIVGRTSHAGQVSTMQAERFPERVLSR